MAMHLDERTVRALPAPAKGSVPVWDDEVTGFGLRVFAPTARHPGGARSFFVNYRVNGVERRHTIGSFPDWSARAARDEAKELRKRIDLGDDPVQERREAREAPTVKELAARYEVEHLSRKAVSTRANDLAMIRNEILPVLGERRVVDVHHGDVAALHRRLTDRGVPARANRVLSVVSKMFSLALRAAADEEKPWRDAAQGNPCRGLERNPEEGRERFFSEAELAALTEALRECGETSAANCLRFLMLTGARPGETMRAEWSEFAEAGYWSKPSAHTKQRRRHRVPLTPAAVELIENIRSKKDENARFVFPGRVASKPLREIQTCWTMARERASIALWAQSSDPKIARLMVDLGDRATIGICRAEAARRKLSLGPGLTDARAYDLRHTFASIGAGGGLSLLVIGRLLGHTQSKTTQRYAHLADDPLREAANKIGGVIAGAGKEGGRVVKLRSARNGER